MDSILQHLATTIMYDMAPKAFLEKYLVNSPVLQVFTKSKYGLEKYISLFRMNKKMLLSKTGHWYVIFSFQEDLNLECSSNSARERFCCCVKWLQSLISASLSKSRMLTRTSLYWKETPNLQCSLLIVKATLTKNPNNQSSLVRQMFKLCLLIYYVDYNNIVRRIDFLPRIGYYLIIQSNY